MNAVALPVSFSEAAAVRTDVVKPSQAHNAGKYVQFGVLAVVWTSIYAMQPWDLSWAVLFVPLLALFLRAAWIWADLACMSYRFDDGQRVVWSQGVLSRETGSLEMFRIQNITLHQSLFQRLAGVGTVVLETRDATNPYVQMVGLRQPEAFRERMTSYVQKARKLRGVQEAAVN